MATLKLKHLILYSISFILLIFAEVPGGALFALLVWMQLALLLWNKKFDLKTQAQFLVIFVSLLPAYFLWGAINSFLLIYVQQSHLAYTVMSIFLSYLMSFWMTLFTVFSYAYAKDGDPLTTIFNRCISKVKNHTLIFIYVSLIVFLITVCPVPLAVDYRIVIGIIVAHLFLRSSSLKLALRN